MPRAISPSPTAPDPRPPRPDHRFRSLSSDYEPEYHYGWERRLDALGNRWEGLEDGPEEDWVG